MWQDFPILVVIDDRADTWQVLYATIEDPADGMLACPGCLFQRFPEFDQCAGLARGHAAVRSASPAAWSVLEIEYGEW